MNVKIIDVKDCHSEYSILKKILNVGSGYSHERAMFWLTMKYQTDRKLPLIKLVNLQRNERFEQLVERLKEERILSGVDWKTVRFPVKVEDNVILSVFSFGKDTSMNEAFARLTDLGYSITKSTFRKRVCNLEYKGKLCRTVRIGGNGGTCSSVLRME